MEVVPFPIAKEYEKHRDITPEDIARIKEWLHTQPHLPAQHITDMDILLVYNCCRGSLERTKQLLDTNYTLRTMFPNHFGNRCLNEHSERIMNSVLFAALPPTPQGYRSVYCRLIDLDPKNFNFTESVHAVMMMLDLWQYEEGTWPGFIIIIDMHGSSLKHIAKVDINSLRQALYFMQEGILVILKAVHFINAPPFMDTVMTLVKPFAKKHLMDRLQVHAVGSETIYESVPKECFPKDLGGGYKTCNEIRDELKEKIRANEKFFKEEEKQRVQESLRPGGKRTMPETFGTEGSFKKLDID